MSDKKKNPPCDPATDKEIEKLQVQVDYGANLTITLLRSGLGAVLARLAKAEANLATEHRCIAMTDEERAMWVARANEMHTRR